MTSASASPAGHSSIRSPPSALSLLTFCALPDEIKVLILQHMLPRNLFLTADMFSKTLRTDERGIERWSSIFETDVLPFLIALPVVKPLVYDAVFANNTVQTQYERFLAIRHPSPSMANFVRRVQLHLELNVRCLDFLREFARTYSTLLHVDIYFHGGLGPDTSLRGEDLSYDLATFRGQLEAVRQDLDLMEPIEVETKNMVVAYEHNNLEWHRGMPPREQWRDTWTMPLLEKIGIKGGIKNVQWGNFEFVDHPGLCEWREKRQGNSEWPDVMDVEDCFPRKTVKKMCA